MKLYYNKDKELREPNDVFISQKLTNYSRTTSLNKQELDDSSTLVNFFLTSRNKVIWRKIWNG